ncbi:MAG TPA: SAM-dependent methyltransferase [Gammaproteobacteria bacterium]|nr:SAM-dependent methyltransferase [Gammaproteobacteria bacterium]
MTANVFNAYSHYYDLLYRDKDYAAEVAYIDDLLKRFSVTGSDLLEFGSGTGKHGRLLAEHGYQVTGIERSAEMAAQATGTQGFSCQQGDIRTVRIGRCFDAVLALFHVISYQVTNADVRATFTRAAEHLPPGGLFLFDVWYSPAVYAQKPEVRIKRLTGNDMEITRIAEPEIYPNENRIDVLYTLFIRDLSTNACQTLTEIHPMRHFSLPELDLLATSAGFEPVNAEEFLTGEASGEKTWGVCLVWRKI